MSATTRRGLFGWIAGAFAASKIPRATVSEPAWGETLASADEMDALLAQMWGTYRLQPTEFIIPTEMVELLKSAFGDQR